MKAKSAIAKGKYLEDYVASQIRELGIDKKATRSHGSGNTNTEKGDIWTSMRILGQNAGIECKNQKVIKLPDWWRQVQKLESLGREPVLVVKSDRDPLEETKVVIYLDTFLRLVANQGQESEQKSEQDNPRLKYAMARLRDNLREVTKLIDS